MRKLAIIYFSGTGNTKYIAEKMKEAAVKTNTQVDLIDIEKGKINANKYDNIVIGGPVYVERYPEILLKYLENNLSDYKGNCMMYSTQAFNGPTPVFVHAIKRLKNLKFVYCDYVPMPNNFYTFMFKKCKADKEADLLLSSSIQSQIMILEFLEGKTKIKKIPGIRIPLAETTYKMTFPFLRKFLMKSLKINKDKCIKCKKCENLCPSKSIHISPELKISNDCTFCQRCINICPKNAFLYKGKPIDQYNIKL